MLKEFTESREEPDSTGRQWPFRPINTLSPSQRRLSILLGTLFVVAASGLQNGDLHDSWGLPDVSFYLNMAIGRIGNVPQPFTARPLAPLLAHWLTLATHLPLTAAFGVLAYISLTCTAAIVFYLLSRVAAPRWLLPVVALVPFWPQLLGYVGLPDPLYTCLVALLLLALEQDWPYVAAALMLPLMLARESTSLTLACLLIVAWRRLRWAGSALAIGSAVVGTMIVQRLSVGGLPNPEHLSGPVYMVGKVVSNTFRSLGVMPWSNVYQDLCGAPAWQHAVPLGPVHSVGVCTWSPTSPIQSFWAFLTTFGILPLLGFAFWRRAVHHLLHGSLVVRFSLLYGTISLLLAPTLGTWYARLFGYAWPLLLVAVPRLLTPQPASSPGPAARRRYGVLVALLVFVHGIVCALGIFGRSGAAVVAVFALQAIAIALIWGLKGSLAGPHESPAPSLLRGKI